MMIEAMLDDLQMPIIPTLIPTIHCERGEIGYLHDPRRAGIEEEHGFDQTSHRRPPAASGLILFQQGAYLTRQRRAGFIEYDDAPLDSSLLVLHTLEKLIEHGTKPLEGSLIWIQSAAMLRPECRLVDDSREENQAVAGRVRDDLVDIRHERLSASSWQTAKQASARADFAGVEFDGPPRLEEGELLERR